VEAVSRLRVVDGAAEVLERLREAGWVVALLSGSVDIVLDHFFRGGLSTRSS